VLHLNKDGILTADKHLINDVREQNGGGGEPLLDLLGSTSTPTEFVSHLAENTANAAREAGSQAAQLAEATANAAKGAGNQVANLAETATRQVDGAVATTRRRMPFRKDLSVVREGGGQGADDDDAEDDPVVGAV